MIMQSIKPISYTKQLAWYLSKKPFNAAPKKHIYTTLERVLAKKTSEYIGIILRLA